MKRKAAQAAHRKKKIVKSSESIGPDGLTDKQRAFVEHYLTCWNATEAARQAGYKTARQTGSENLSKPVIRALIHRRLSQMAMAADEVLARLSAMAGADMSDFLVPSGKGLKLDLKAARAAGRLHLVKKYNKTKQGLSIELYDAQAALVQLGKHHGLFAERIKLETWQSEIVELLKSGRISAEEVIQELGFDDARQLLIAAGTPIPARAPAPENDGADSASGDDSSRTEVSRE